MLITRIGALVCTGTAICSESRLAVLAVMSDIAQILLNARELVTEV